MAKKETPKKETPKKETVNVEPQVNDDEKKVEPTVNPTELKPVEPQVKPLRFGVPVLQIDIVSAKEKIADWRKTGKQSFSWEEVGNGSGVVLIGTKTEDFVVDFNKIPQNSAAELGLLRLGLTTRIRNIFARPKGASVPTDIAKTELVRDSIDLLLQGLWSKPTKSSKTAEEKAAEDRKKDRLLVLTTYSGFVRGMEYKMAVQMMSKFEETKAMVFESDEEKTTVLRLAEILN